jgi:cell wall-associated NlpC family hydrolase
MARLLIILLALGGGACASTGHVPQPFPQPGEHSAPRPAPAPSAHGAPGTGTAIPADAYGITGTALALRGAPYRNGGADPTGFDCSGFVWYVFAQHGVTLPRTVSELYRVGGSVNGTGLEPGDLVFFNTAGSGASHVGIAIGGDEFVHAPSSNGEVRVERLSGGYWASRFIGARRVL